MSFTIMVIDDSRLILRAVSEALDDTHRLLLETSALDAIEHLKIEFPDLIILDLSMPVMDGYEMLKYLKANDELREIPVVLLSVSNRDNHQDLVANMGVLDYIEKPFKYDYLKSRVELYLDLIASKKKIKKQAEEIEFLMANLPGGILKYSADDDKELDFISVGVLNIFGLTDDAFRKKYGNKFANIIYEEDREEALSAINNHLKEGKDELVEYRVTDARGKLIWLYNKVKTVTDDNGKKWFINVLVEISQYKKIQDDLKKSEQYYKFSAQRDLLTNLYNKTTTIAMIDDCIKSESGQMHAMFSLDLDNFKNINDNFGHLFGDSVLVEISAIIAQVFRSTDILGRFGGDEFVIFVKNIKHEEYAIKKADELVETLTKTYNEGKESQKISGSVGIAFYPRHGKTFLELYGCADNALYLSKNSGRGRHAVCDK